MRFVSLPASGIFLALLSTFGWGQVGDECVNPIPILSGVPAAYITSGTTISSEVTPGCPLHGVDLWYAFVPQETREYQVQACGTSSHNWVVSVLDSCAGSALDCRGFNCTFEDPIIPFAAVAGETYLIRASAITGSSGLVTVSPFDRHPNDNCDSATAIHGLGEFAFDLEQATLHPLPDGVCGINRFDVWYRWTAPYDEAVVMGVDTANTILTVYDGCGGEVLECLRTGSSGEQVTFVVDSGQDYWLRIGGIFSQFRPVGKLNIQRQEVVTWSTNSHAYWHEIDLRMDWDSAQAYAESWVLRGMPGHLATLTSEAEIQFVLGQYQEAYLPYFGLFQDLEAPDFSEPAGGWKWVTGEPLSYTNWLPNRPDNHLFLGSPENFGGLALSGRWDDQGEPFSRTFLMEWDLGPSIGTTFCDPAQPNSIGLPTALEAQSSPVSETGVRLEAFNGPPGRFGYFLIGSNSADPGLPVSQGTLCLDLTAGSSLGRYNQFGGALNSLGQFDTRGVFINLVGTTSTGTGFDVPSELPFPAQPIIQAGETWHLQLWHREPGGESNYSNGLSLSF